MIYSCGRTADLNFLRFTWRFGSAEDADHYHDAWEDNRLSSRFPCLDREYMTLPTAMTSSVVIKQLLRFSASLYATRSSQITIMSHINAGYWSNPVDLAQMYRCAS